jgi:hypothetical protein
MPVSVPAHADGYLARSRLLFGELFWANRNDLLLTTDQLLGILLLGFLSFPAMFFFCALYLQKIFGYSSLITALCLLPAAVSGVVVNVS